MSDWRCCGADRSALRVRARALFWMVGLERVEGLSRRSKSVARMAVSTGQESEETNCGEREVQVV